MNLRHKKPINSYRGQGNDDKNEFNDDDFKHQPSPSKKLVGSSGEQMYKYSKILAKFIMNANQYYRERKKNHRKQKNDIEKIIEEAKTAKEENRNIKQGKRLQQPKQKRKISMRIQHEKLQHEKLQFKQEKQKQTHKIEAQSSLPHNNIKPEHQKIPPKTLSSKTAVSVNEPTQTKIQPPQNKDKNISPFPESMANLYPQGIPMPGFPNQNLLTGLNINQYMEYYKMMELAMYQSMIKNEQLKGMGFPNLLPQMMSGMMATPAEFLNLKQNLYQTYMKKNMAQQIAQLQPTQRNAPIHNLTEAYLTKKQPLFNESKQKPNEIVKRANFHVGIAYQIYLIGLEQKGVDTKNINLIDPTRLSREIKQRQMGSKRTSRSRNKK